MLYDTRSSRPNSILVSAYRSASVLHPGNSRYVMTTVRTLDKLLQKRALRSLIRLEENAHHMVRLVPTIEGLLQVQAALVNKDLDRAWIGDMSVCFEFLSDTMSDVCRCDGDGIQGDDFRCLRAFRCEHKRLAQSSRNDSRHGPSLCKGR